MANRKRIPWEERFWEKVDRGHPEACWPWQGATTPKGYGRFRFPWGTVRAHRLAWAICANVAPERLPHLAIDVHHTCENNGCCNPHHLEAIDSKTHDKIHARDLARQLRRIAKK